MGGICLTAGKTRGILLGGTFQLSLYIREIGIQEGDPRRQWRGGNQELRGQDDDMEYYHKFSEAYLKFYLSS